MPPVRRQTRYSHISTSPYARARSSSPRGFFDTDTDTDCEPSTPPIARPRGAPTPSPSIGQQPSTTELLLDIQNQVAALRREVNDLTEIAQSLTTVVRQQDRTLDILDHFYNNFPLLIAAQVRRGLLTFAEESGHSTLRAPTARPRALDAGQHPGRAAAITQVQDQHIDQILRGRRDTEIRDFLPDTN